MSDVVQSARRLRQAAQSGGLEGLCRGHGVSLLVLFGSARGGERAAHDVDVAVRFDPYAAGRVLAFLDALAEVAETDKLDLLVLNTAGPVAREQALVFGDPLFMSSRDLMAEEQIRATMQRLETDDLRRQELDLLRSSA